MRHYPNEKLVCKTEDGLTVTVFRPSLFHVVPRNSGNLETERGVKLRFLYRMFIGFQIYLMRKNDEFIAYAMFQKGKIARYPFVEKNMLLMGPYFVAEAHRGNGYAGQILDLAFSELKGYSTVYAWIVSDNAASRNALYKTGFNTVGWLQSSGMKRDLIQSETRIELLKKTLKD